MAGYRVSKERLTYEVSCEEAEVVIDKTLRICKQTSENQVIIRNVLMRAHQLNIQLVRLAIPKMVLRADIDRAHNTIAHLQGLIAATEPA